MRLFGKLKLWGTVREQGGENQNEEQGLAVLGALISPSYFYSQDSFPLK